MTTITTARQQVFHQVRLFIPDETCWQLAKRKEREEMTRCSLVIVKQQRAVAASSTSRCRRFDYFLPLFPTTAI